MLNRKQHSLISTLYKDIFKKLLSDQKSKLTIERFYEYVIPSSVSGLNDTSTMGKYIRNPEKIPLVVRNFYLNNSNIPDVVMHLKLWVSYIDNQNEAVAGKVLSYLKEIDENKLVVSLENSLEKRDYTNFYYILFRYGLTGNLIDGNTYDQFLEKNRQKYFEEFCSKILEPYGISGKTGSTIILQMAESGSQNPYILFEAAEIEYAKKVNSSYSVNEQKSSLQKAYNYCKTASKIGFPLADWALGYMVQLCNDKGWMLEGVSNMKKEERIAMAISYYKKSADAGCIKAYNSLGNMASRENLAGRKKLKLRNARYYYAIAAESGNIFGMYNYARTIEKELKLMYAKANPLTFVKKGKTMIKYYQKAADLGYAPACYRTALYYGGFDHPDKIKFEHSDVQFVEYDIALAINYLEKATRGISPGKEIYELLIHLMTVRPDLFYDNQEILQKKIINYENILKHNYPVD